MPAFAIQAGFFLMCYPLRPLLHDVDDPKAAEKAYRTAAHRIATKH